MTVARVFLVLVLLSVSTVCSGTVFTVDPRAGGDFLTVPAAWGPADAGDTLLLVAGYHLVGHGMPGWPLTLNADSPVVYGPSDGGEAVLLGDGTTVAFVLGATTMNARMEFRRITFRSLGELFKRNSMDSGGSLTFTDNVVEDCRSSYAVDVRSCPSSYVARNVIRNNTGTGFATYHNSGVFQDNEICFNAGGIRGGCCENPTVRRNHIHHNTSYGIIPGTFSFTILNNVIEYNGGFGVFANPYCRIEQNVIRYNTVGVKAYDTHCRFKYNDMYGNTDFNFVTLVTYGDAYQWDCSNNWWGTTDPVAIAASIRDCQDDSALKLCAQFEPWCDSPGCAATPVRKSTWGSIKAMYR